MAKFYSIVVLATLAVAAHGIPRPFCPCYYALDSPVAAPMASDVASDVISPETYPIYPGCPCNCGYWVCPLCVQQACDCPVAEAIPADQIASDVAAMPAPAVDCICPVTPCDPCTFVPGPCNYYPYPYPYDVVSK